jgi:predicted enzyme related to lactoylglutathione lyase
VQTRDEEKELVARVGHGVVALPKAGGYGDSQGVRRMTRRDALSLMVSLTALPFTARDGGPSPAVPLNSRELDTHQGEPMQIHYLEIVTTDVETICDLYSRIHGVTFGDANQNLGGARTARLASGGLLGVRAPLNDGERPVVRPYILVKDIEAAVAAAAKAGAEIIVPPMKIPGHGTCAIFYQGKIESGLFQV